ncbi:tripartite tricarboxylate transporter substrate-binding protein [Pseudomonas sp. HR96]|uniref:Bug family tripartite tricarboxylate transporter substrate binding protein n=1 Tax=Pseudomonas sp. HR96 TaxID=1027966 RepID=UPI002A7508CE|nr:tripartite tricarboxylate transporter substrate-binding protein [Pseudomonas sp. HR96]WPO97718.1 tripartite tricarboxylate transporter substrate-binding protein [Pseudomonas sp. HR96]
MFDRRRFLFGSGALLLGAHLPAFATSTPPLDGPRLIFGYPPGSIGSELGESCLSIYNARAGGHFSFTNIDSHNSRTATELVKNGPADGTLLLQAQSTSMVLLPSVYRDLGYNPLQDFAPVVSLTQLSGSLTVGPLVPARVTNLAQYLDWVTDNPDLRDVGYAMYGSQGHMATLMLARAKSVAISGRPYKGSLMMLKDLMSGGLAAGFTAAGNGNQDLWASGKLRSLGVTGAHREAHWPNVPTLAEQGVAGMDLNAWYAWYAPATTPPAVLQQLRDKAHTMKTAPEFAPLLKRLNLTALNLDPEQIQQLTTRELASYQQLVRQFGIRPLD